MTAVQLLIGFATLVANAFFVGAEFALISVRRSQIEPYAEQGDRRARSVLWGLQHVSALMAASQPIPDDVRCRLREVVQALGARLGDAPSNRS